jgi:alkanesulfonate monooxygenase SsuD/methylene tetrahydromethanopterin reductase-like flavin-dependent oxidoreductase (luciferase family)
VGSYVLFMVIADETDEAARAKWEHYKAGADDEALAWLTEQSQKDTRSGSDTNVRQMADPPRRSISTWAPWSALTPASPACSTKWRRARHRRRAADV